MQRSGEGGRLVRSQGLDPRSLAAVRALEAEVVAHDGGRLKLEHAVLAGDPERVQCFLRWDGDRLVGFAGAYDFGGLEIAGMVAPDARRQGIGSALLDAALAEKNTALLVVPSGSAAGRALAQRRGGALSHSEHFLVLGDTPVGPEDLAVAVREAGPADWPEVRRVLRAAFGWEPPEQHGDRPGDTTLVIERGREVVGTVRLSARGEAAGVYGLAVDPSYQGQGIGRDVLGRVCRRLRGDGCERVTLEVETRNEHALRLYTASGFVREAGEDYWVVRPNQ